MINEKRGIYYLLFYCLPFVTLLFGTARGTESGTGSIELRPTRPRLDKISYSEKLPDRLWFTDSGNILTLHFVLATGFPLKLYSPNFVSVKNNFF